MAIELPRVGVAVMLRDLAGAVYGSRIEAVDPHAVTVVKPTSIPAAQPFLEGTPLDLLWTDPVGRHVLPTELLRSVVEGQVLLWQLVPVTEPWVEQRREFVRVPAFGRVSMRVIHDEAPESADPTSDETADEVPPSWSGYLVDVSEAALQATLWTEPGEPVPITATRVLVEFAAHGTEFSRTGVIYGARRASREQEMTVVVTFEQTRAEATALRREVFAAQLDLRDNFRRR